MLMHATTIKQISKEDRRRKLEERLNRFHRKAEEYMGENAEEDLDILPQFTGWDPVDFENTKGPSDPWKDYDADENEVSEKPETMPICMPSSLKRDDIQRLGLSTLASQELELRKGQANDCAWGS
jgi:hypothetical protein